MRITNKKILIALALIICGAFFVEKYYQTYTKLAVTIMLVSINVALIAPLYVYKRDLKEH